jgi:hypothetical protein
MARFEVYAARSVRRICGRRWPRQPARYFCSSRRPGRKPGASPLLFGKYLMDHCAFIGLEDISDGLPSYREEVVPVLAVMVTKSYRIAF